MHSSGKLDLSAGPRARWVDGSDRGSMPGRRAFSPTGSAYLGRDVAARNLRRAVDRHRRRAENAVRRPIAAHLKLLEPLRELFKHEVRALGVSLGLPHEMAYRHPFPGPGLGARILGKVRRECADLLRRADHIFIEELRRAGRYDKVSQAFVVLLLVRSVGFMGEDRTYEWAVALRVVQTQDFMTTHSAHLPHSLLGRVVNRIFDDVRGINRVVYDISGKPAPSIEWE